jgi:hypothetical protein
MGKSRESHDAGLAGVVSPTRTVTGFRRACNTASTPRTLPSRGIPGDRTLADSPFNPFGMSVADIGTGQTARIGRRKFFMRSQNAST